MAKRNKLVHIHSNVYTNGAPQAPQAGVLNKGEIAVNYNDTEPALFIENNSGQVVKFNAITKSEIQGITGNVTQLSSDIGDIQSNNKIVLNGTEKTMTGSTWSFYAPTASGAANTVLVSDGANKSPKWVAQSGLSVGTASEASKTTGKLTLNTNGTQKVVFNGSADTSVNISYSDVGAAASTHGHDAEDLPTASTSEFGIIKIGTGATNAAAGNHTHSSYVNPTVTNCAQTLSWNTTVTAATIGSTAITLKAMAKPTPGDIGAAAASHNHDAGDLPTASTSDYGVMKVGTSLSASDGVVKANTASTSAYGVVKIGSGLVNGTGTSAGTISVATATSDTHGVVKAGNFIGIDANGIISAKTGTTSSTVARGDHSHTPASIGAAAAAHTHDAGDLPTASTTNYGVVRLGTGSGDAAQGDHTHPSYVNPTVVNCGQTLSWGSEAVVGKVGATSLTVKAMSKPTPSDIGAATASHTHDAEDLPTAATNAYGVMKVGTSLSATDGIVSVNTASTTGFGVMKVGTGLGVSNGVVNVATAGTSSYGIMKGGNFTNVSSAGVISVATGTSSTTVARGDHSHTPASIGAAPASHTHDAADLPTATTSDYGLVKLGTGATDAATGNHTHSAYVNPTVVNCGQTLSWGSEATVGKIGTTSLTVKAMAKPTPSDIGAATASHNHDAEDLPTGSTSAYGILKLGSGSTDAATGNHTHSNYVNPTVTNCAQTLSWGATSTAATIGNTAITIKAMAKPTPSDIGAAAASHNHDAGDLPTASTTAYGVIKVGSGATDAAAGNHTHSAYVNPTVTNCAQTLSWNTTVTAATIGSTAITVKAMAKPTPSDIGAAAATHSHTAGDLPTGSTSAYGILKLGTGAGEAAQGTHTHSAYVNPTVTDCAQTLSWNTTVTAATIGSTALTIKAMAKPTPGDIGAAAATHSHAIGDLPYDTGFSNATDSKVPTTKAVKSYVDGLVASPVNYKGAVTTGAVPASGSTHVGDMYIVQTSAISLTTATSATGAAQTAETGDYIIARATNKWDVIQKNLNGAVTANEALTADYFVMGNGNQVIKKSSYNASSFATKTHSHTASDLPTASTSAYGIIKVGTGATDAAAGNHTHSAYVNPTVTNCGQTLSWDTTVTAATIGSTAITVKAMAKPTPGDIGAAPATHSHGAADLPTGSTSAYGILKLGTGAAEAATGNHTHSAYVNPTVTNCGQTLSWDTTVTAATIGSTALTIKAMAKPTPSDIGAAAATHSHTAGDLPTASTTAFGIIKIGTGATNAAAGNHTHSSYVNPTVTNCAQTLSWDTTVTAATIGSTALTIKAMAKPTPSDIGAAASTHSHTAADLPTAATNAYGVMKVGTSLSVSNGVVNASTATTSAYGVVKVGTGLGVSNGTINVSTATSTTYGIVKAGNFVSVSSAGVITVSTGTSSTTIARGDHTHTPASIGAAAASHNHAAADLPTASTTEYGIIKVGTGATDAAAGNHTHSAYVNPTVTNCAQTLSWNTTVTAATIGSTAITVKAMAKPTPGDIGAAAASHNHGAEDLATASTTAYGIVKVGTSLGVSNGVINAATATTGAFGVVKIGSSLSITNGVLSAATATTSAFGVIKPGTFMSISNGVLTISTGTSSSTIARGDHTHTPSSIGASPVGHGHDGSEIDGTVGNSDKVDGYHVSVVTSMPSTPDANTIYILK